MADTTTQWGIGMRSWGRGAGIDLGFVGMLALAGAIVLLFWGSPFVYPIRLFVTLVHELSHALAAIGTGGQVDSIAVFPGADGVALTRGGNMLIIASAGYLGSVLFGAGMLALAKRDRRSRSVLKAIALGLVVADLLFVRNVFGIVATLVLAAGCWALAAGGPDWLVRLALYLLAALTCLYAVNDLTGVLFLSRAGGVVTDAELMARATGLPAVFWAALWLVLGLAALALAGRRLLRM